MSLSIRESQIIVSFAEQLARKISRSVIAELRKMKQTMSGDDSYLKTTWDEICAQMQDERSVYWDAYDHTVSMMILYHVSKLQPHEQAAIWLQSVEGQNWYDDPEDREPVPVVPDDIVHYLANEYVYSEANNYMNSRIRKYIDRPRD